MSYRQLATHPLVLGALAALAGAAPGAAPGGLRALLTARRPEALVVKALSVESVLTSSAAGAVLYGLRGTWPGSLRTQSLVFLLASPGA